MKKIITIILIFFGIQLDEIFLFNYKIIIINLFSKNILLGYVWFSENTKERKKNTKENDFFMFGCPMKNIKENQI